MRQIISQRTYRAMYRLLDRVSPIDGDCGRLCGSICCTIDNAPEIPKSSDNILLQDIEDVNKHNHYKMSDDVTANRDIATAEEDEQVLGIYLYPGEESLFVGLPILWGPGLNTHRHAYNGRNGEYYSEDPVVAGLTASSYILGAQSNDGVGFTMKHFACNNNENGRMFVNDVVSERAIREIYLKGFEIAFKSAQPMALMTSYNGINEVWAVNNYDLITDICKNEWGFKGVVMSDYGAANQAQSNLALSLNKWANIMHAGNDWIWAVLMRRSKKRPTISAATMTSPSITCC